MKLLGTEIANDYATNNPNVLDFASTPGFLIPSMVGIIALTTVMGFIEDATIYSFLIGSFVISGICCSLLVGIFTRSEGLILVAISSFSGRGAFPIVITWMLVNFGGSSKRIASIGIFFFISQMHLLVHPVFTGNLSNMHAYIIFSLILNIVSVVVIILLILHLKAQNSKKSLSETHFRQSQREQIDMCDSHPNFIYRL
ncbi:hypothetical protein AYI68_g1698 [Smittium mucronatum]|uniref:Transporter n=1 Tax=Smittium mucronatum TaxID=133383 RepID=A0A1R0H4U5_9FUNG|nr:hypothetical protein AYI68_g1698 [Smittium mucronatum]